MKHMQHIYERMKHTVATCVHIFAAAQWWLVDAARAAHDARHGRRAGTRREAGPARSDRARCKGARREAGGAGACGATRVRHVQTVGRPDRSISDISRVLQEHYKINHGWNMNTLVEI